MYSNHVLIIIIERHDRFQYPWTRTDADPSCLKDIHDGEVIRVLMKDEGFLSCPENTGLILCTDGVPIFKSSKGSLWPVYLMVTSIPPHLRMRAENLIVAGLWYGSIKPPMNILLRPILNSIQLISEVGVQCFDGSICRAKLLMGVFDLPAKACATNTKQFNGEYGCLYCFHKGERFHRARIYPPMANPCPLKTTEQILALASQAEESGEPKFGVKGKSILSEQLELPACVPVDYMHSILEGVFKQLMKFWFDSKYHGKPFSLRKHCHSINKMIRKLKPPVEIPRVPRSLDALSFYKASEYRAWLLFYGLPVLSKFLTPEYTHHLSLLVIATHILLSDNIKKDDLEVASKLLTCFHDTAGDLYTNTVYTSNMHSLLHLVDFVKIWGPLWVYSMFGFENMNGFLGGTYHGTKRIVLQMSFQLQLRLSLPGKIEELLENETPEIQEHVRRFINRKRSTMTIISDRCYALGQIKTGRLSSEEESILLSIGLNITDATVQKFDRIMFQGIQYSCESYGQKLTRDNSTCSYTTADGTKYGTILSFFLSSAHSSIPFCFIRSYTTPSASSSLIRRPARNLKMRSIPVNDLLKHLFVEACSTDTITAIPVSCIQAKCCAIQVGNTTYITKLPNPFEMH